MERVQTAKCITEGEVWAQDDKIQTLKTAKLGW